jgi:hypothetical protein
MPPLLIARSVAASKTPFDIPKRKKRSDSSMFGVATAGSPTTAPAAGGAFGTLPAVGAAVGGFGTATPPHDEHHPESIIWSSYTSNTRGCTPLLHRCGYCGV